MNSGGESSPARDRGRREGVFQGFLVLLASSYMEAVVGFVRGVLTMRIVGPIGEGLTGIVDLLSRYIGIVVNLGGLQGLSKELPRALGTGDEASATRIENTGTAAVLYLAGLGAMGIILYAALAAWLEPHTRLVLGIGAIFLFLGQLYNLYRIVARSWSRFRILAASAVINTVVLTVLQLAGAFLLFRWRGDGADGAVGVVIAGLLTSVVVLAYLGKSVRICERVQIRWDVAWQLARAGFLLTVIVFADTLLRTADGIVVLKIWKVARFGVYRAAMMAATYLYRLAETAGFVLMPRIWERYAATSDVESLRRQVVDPTIGAATVMPGLSGLAHILVPAFVFGFIPKFHEAIVPTQMLALASVFLVLPVAANGLLIAQNRELIVICTKLIGAGLVAEGALLSVYTRGYEELRWVAVATGVGYFVSALLAVAIVWHDYYRSRLRLWREIALLHAPFIWCIVALKLCGKAAFIMGVSSLGQWPEALFKATLFILLYAPVLWYGNRRTGVVDRCVQLIAQRRGRGSAAPPSLEAMED